MLVKRVLVTGGAGFISSNFIRHLLAKTPYDVVSLDALTYAGNVENLKDVMSHERLSFVHGDIRDADLVRDVVAQCDVIVNAAAESHVEKSIEHGASEFVTTNVEGTQILLDAIRAAPVERFILISSSEVYGTAERAPMDEEHPLNPRSPYAATKAGADRLAYSYFVTYGLPIVIVRPFNNYGPRQHPEKVIPRFVTQGLRDEPLTIHGDGHASRDWLYVDDDAEAIEAVIAAPLDAVVGEVLNVATGIDISVAAIADSVLDLLGKPESLKAFVTERPGQVDRHIGSTDKLERLASAERVDGVIAPGIDWPVAIAARVAERLSLPHPISPETAALSTSKLRQRERFAAAGVPQPGYVVCSGAAEAADAANELGFPCVIKAPDRQGQRGLTLVAEPRHVASAVEIALDASRSATLLVEEHVAGRELTVNGFSVGGRFRPLTVTDRLTAEPPAFGVALAHVWPSELDPRTIADAIEVAGAAGAALGIADGPSYTQILVGGDGQPCVGELAARLGGGHDAELCRAVLGVDLNGLALAAALGRAIALQQLAPVAREGGGCVRFLVAPPGQLRGVTGLEEAYALDGVKGIRLYRQPGHAFGALLRGPDRAGAILAVGAARADALDQADRAAALVRFDVEQAPASPLEKV